MPASCAVAPSQFISLTNHVDKSTVRNSFVEKKQESESSSDTELQVMVLEGLRRTTDKKKINFPFHFLYDKKGSELYEEITKLDGYYPFKAESELLDEHVDDIASCIPEGSVVVELGCGSAKKTSRLLNGLISRHGRCRFVGIDVSASFLDEASCNLMLLVEGKLSLELVHAEYLEGLRIVREKYPNELLCLLWLGSSVGNLSERDAISFFKEVLDAAKSRCRIFLCADMWKKAATLYDAYRDRDGVNERFIKNGMLNAMRILGYQPSEMEANESSWVHEVEINHEVRHVEMYIKFQQGLNLPRHQVHIKPGERVLTEISRKFTAEDIQYMAEESGLHVLSAWRNEKYGGQMLLTNAEALTQCWEDTDTLFHGLSDWSVQPIEVRHPFYFNYGHLTSFMKLKMFPDESPSDLDTMFSIGIDPLVVDPTKCHGHPEIPDESLKLEEIVEYVMTTRKKVLAAIAGEKKKGQSRLINFILEHDRVHQETLTYMIAQERKVAFEKTMTQVQQNGYSTTASTENQVPSTDSILQALSESKMITIEPGAVVLGADAAKTSFMWDNEYPQFHTSVSTSFRVSTGPISMGEFYRFVLEGGYDEPSLWEPDDFKYIKEKGRMFPATWSRVENEVYVHAFQATHHWLKVAHQPVFVSLSEAQAFCRWVGCRIMTEGEYQRILDVDRYEKTVQQMRTGGWEWTSTPFEPFPGFKAMPEYPECSTDCFDGQHFVLKGSSPVTHPSMIRDSFRNCYQRQYPYVFAKFRCCKS